MTEHGYSRQQLCESMGAGAEANSCVVQTRAGVCFPCGNMMAWVPVQRDTGRPLWGTKQGLRVIREIMWSDSQSRGSK